MENPKNIIFSDWAEASKFSKMTESEREEKYPGVDGVIAWDSNGMKIDSLWIGETIERWSDGTIVQ